MDEELDNSWDDIDNNYVSNDIINTQTPESNEVDQHSTCIGNEVLVKISTSCFDDHANSTSIIRSRVLHAFWHALKRIEVPKKHGLRFKFQRVVTDVIMVMDKDDVNRVKAYLKKKNKDFDHIHRTRKSWLLSRVRRIIPLPEELFFPVRCVFVTFGPLKCITSRKPLFEKKKKESRHS
ncbi:hypothetical protein BDC45DRAFT_506054 [Circinella umbellata]|nr:hypothetical protein BDC45DRAFT_506054 [Circinella umbellata]